MPGWLLLLLFGGAAGWLATSLLVALSVRRLSRPEALLRRRGRARCPEQGPLSRWAADAGFRPAECFEFDGVLGSPEPVEVQLWSDPRQEILLLRYCFRDAERHEFVSYLEDGGQLITSAAGETLNLPLPPGHFLQVFPAMAPEPLLDQHRLALAHIERETGRRPEPAGSDLHRRMLDGIRRQMEHVRAQPLWYLRAPWWALSRPGLANRPLAGAPAAG